jgi:pimeloyl-ACP methyl ester carboxylesterase
MLHALMSASDTGYRLWAQRFNELGWNACFIHLPFHYSRTPRGFMNGELAISADLVRTAQGLRQGVVELRQLMQMLRERGCREFGIWGTSYGGWIGALLSFVESDFRFIALMQPIANVEHAVWESGAAIWMRRRLRKGGVDPSLVERHFHLASPMHNQPLCGGDKILLVAGEYDRIALPEDIRTLHEKWTGSEMFVVPQGHFGYRVMPATLDRLRERGVF